MEKIKRHIDELKAIDSQRKKWLFLSMFVTFAVTGIIFQWDYVQTSRLIWVLASLGLLVSVIWWYWTMKLIRLLINYKISEYEILGSIVSEVRQVHQEVKNNFEQTVDKVK